MVGRQGGREVRRRGGGKVRVWALRDLEGFVARIPKVPGSVQ